MTIAPIDNGVTVSGAQNPASLLQIDPALDHNVLCTTWAIFSMWVSIASAGVAAIPSTLFRLSPSTKLGRKAEPIRGALRQRLARRVHQEGENGPRGPSCTVPRSSARRPFVSRVDKATARGYYGKSTLVYFQPIGFIMLSETVVRTSVLSMTLHSATITLITHHKPH